MSAADTFQRTLDTPDWDEHRRLLAEAQEQAVAERASALDGGPA